MTKVIIEIKENKEDKKNSTVTISTSGYDKEKNEDVKRMTATIYNAVNETIQNLSKLA